MLARILDDQHGPVVIDAEVVPSARRDHAVEQVVAAKQRLPQGHEALTFELEAELAAHRARAAVAAHQIVRGDAETLAGRGLDLAANMIAGLRERDEFRPIPDADVGNAFRRGFEQRLQRVLGDDLIGLERQGAVVGDGDARLGLRHRRERQLHQRRFRHREDEVVVHRPIRGIAGIADGLRQPQATEHLHGPRIAALHLGVAERRFVLLDQDAADAAAAEIDRQGEADRAGADNQDLGMHRYQLLRA